MCLIREVNKMNGSEFIGMNLEPNTKLIILIFPLIITGFSLILCLIMNKIVKGIAVIISKRMR